MRLSIVDEDARTLSRVFYNELARGVPVEEALFQTRLTLAQSPRSWVVGVPVLYTSLTEPAPGFVCRDGTPTIAQYHPHVDVSVLPPVEGTFQGRIKDLVDLGTELTGDQRPRIVTILGSGGQGKTALALKAVERFAFAWSGGVWATTLENLPARSTYVISLAQFVGIGTQETLDPTNIERLLLARLNERRTLLVLDNAETLVEAVEAKNEDALDLVEFLKKLPGTSVSLLVTSRVPLGWDDEHTHELGGLSPEEGAELFRQGAPQRRDEIDRALAESLSRRLEGHPLGLRLLAGAFNDGGSSLSAFLQGTEERLREAENKYVGLEHRHRKLYACIETSVRSLDPSLRSLLSGLWIFHAPFLAETAVAIFDPDAQETEHSSSPVRDHLYQLWRRSLLMRKTVTARDGTLQLYVLLPTTRPYVEHHLEQTYDRERLRKRLITVYSRIAELVYRELNRSAVVVTLAQQVREDLEWVCEAFEQEERAATDRSTYLLYWGWVLYRLGNSQRGLQLLERALEAVEGMDSWLTLQISNNMAGVYGGIGRPQEALKLFEEALPIRREVGDRAGEAATLNGLAYLYQSLQRYSEAFTAFEQSIILSRQITYPAAEIAGLVGLALLLYRHLNRPTDAIMSLEQALQVFTATGLPQDAAGHTVEEVQQLLAGIRDGTISNTPSTLMQTIRSFVNAEDWDATRRVLEAQHTVLFQLEVEAIFERNIEQAKIDKQERAVQLLEMHLALLRACKNDGIAETFERFLKQAEEEPFPFDVQLIPRSINALLGGPQEKMEHLHYLATLSAETTDEPLKALVNVIQLALFGGDRSHLGQDLEGVYRQAWETILAGIATTGGETA